MTAMIIKWVGLMLFMAVLWLLFRKPKNKESE